MGFLTRPVTGYETHDHPGHHEHGRDYDSGLYHINVPFNRPNTMLTAIAVMNTPASMYTKSM